MKIIKESLNEAMTDEQKVEMHHKVYQAVSDTINEVFDNYAMTLHTKIPEYDASWCNADGSSKVFSNCTKHQDSFAIALTNLLLDGMDNE